MINSINPYGNLDISQLKEIWEPRKEYIEKDLWVIRNFLSEEEVSWLNEQANDPKDWYSTMRSPYAGNTKNKFIGYIAQYDKDGVMILPDNDMSQKYFQSTKYHEWQIDKRIESVVPKVFTGAASFQSFFSVPDEQIIDELGSNVDYAMDWHYEQDYDFDGIPITARIEDNIMTAAISIYINDNYEGGVLEFKNKDYVVKPEAGMIVNIPIYKEFEHRVSKVTKGNRHTLYGKSWLEPSKIHVSTNEDC
jgi:hypothetical protein